MKKWSLFATISLCLCLLAACVVPPVLCGAAGLAPHAAAAG